MANICGKAALIFAGKSLSYLYTTVLDKKDFVSLCTWRREWGGMYGIALATVVCKREEETLSKMNIADGYWRIIFFQIRLLNLLGIFEENSQNYVV